MSIIAINWAWDIKGLKPAVKLLLMKLADYADEDHSCFPGNELLAEKCEISVRTVIEYVKVLSDKGLVVVERRTNAAGYRTSNRYWLSVETYVSGSAGSALRSDDDPSEANDSGSADSASRPESKVQNPDAYVQTAALIGDPPAVNHFPPTPAPRGSSSLPHPNIAAALAGKPLASEETRVCKTHKRQRATCIQCWTFRPITMGDIPWCGECDSATTRFVQVDPDDARAGVLYCPRCHPKAMTPAALEQAAPALFGGATERGGQGPDYAIPRGDREL